MFTGALLGYVTHTRMSRQNRILALFQYSKSGVDNNQEKEALAAWTKLASATLTTLSWLLPCAQLNCDCVCSLTAASPTPHLSRLSHHFWYPATLASIDIHPFSEYESLRQISICRRRIVKQQSICKYNMPEMSPEGYAHALRLAHNYHCHV